MPKLESSQRPEPDFHLFRWKAGEGNVCKVLVGIVLARPNGRVEARPIENRNEGATPARPVVSGYHQVHRPHQHSTLLRYNLPIPMRFLLPVSQRVLQVYLGRA